MKAEILNTKRVLDGDNHSEVEKFTDGDQQAIIAKYKALGNAEVLEDIDGDIVFYSEL